MEESRKGQDRTNPWKETGLWYSIGPGLGRYVERTGRDMALRLILGVFINLTNIGGILFSRVIWSTNDHDLASRADFLAIVEFGNL